MKREDFVKIIKIRSCWEIDKRRGNYKLPSGERLSVYVTTLIESQLKIDNLGIRENGNLCFCTGGEWNKESKEFDNFTLFPDFEANESCTYNDMERRIQHLASEIIG